LQFNPKEYHLTELKLSTAAGDITAPADTMVKSPQEVVKPIPTDLPKTDGNSATKPVEVPKDAVKPAVTG